MYIGNRLVCKGGAQMEKFTETSLYRLTLGCHNLPESQLDLGGAGVAGHQHFFINDQRRCFQNAIRHDAG